MRPTIAGAAGRRNTRPSDRRIGVWQTLARGIGTPMPQGRIFISYRRGSDNNAAGRIYDRLESAFGRDRLFMDVDAIPPGVDFVEYLDRQVSGCEAFLVVIGPGWLAEAPRLCEPADFVRIEIEAALKRPAIPIIPVLIDNARMPEVDSLPESLRPLARRNAISVPHEHFAAVVDGRLTRALRKAVAAEAHEPGAKPPSGGQLVPSGARRRMTRGVKATLAGGTLALSLAVGVYAVRHGVELIAAARSVLEGLTESDKPGTGNSVKEQLTTKEPEPAPQTQVIDNVPLPIPVTPPPIGSDEDAEASTESALQEAESLAIVTAGDPPSAGCPAGLAPLSLCRDCPDCPEMVVIPAGSFMMGSPGSEEGRFDSEGPLHEVTIKSFGLARTEATFDQWQACVDGGGCASNPNPDDGGWGRGDRPVINVSWDDAQEYIAWLNTKLESEPYRLPSEAEWEYAARAGTTTPFFFGETISIDQANYWPPMSSEFFRKKTVPVDELDAANAWGLRHMHGNVLEWVQDCAHRTYTAAPTDGSAWMDEADGDCSYFIQRGGSYGDQHEILRSASRSWNDRGWRYYALGFRVARTLIP